ncbi:2-hydroxyacid dehydrogenase [Vagococcus fluvialis]|uniref:2-hydroxyacid dehydrogenase n=1 Tax=Vagococcus fluvialis TaxID=2738 RepID=UPI0037D07C2E
MKAIVIGDALVSSSVLEEACFQMNFEYPITEVDKFEWYSNLSKDEFQEHILEIERFGPEKVTLPENLLDSLLDADYIFCHYAPISKEMILAAPNLKMVGTCRGGLENVNLEALKENNVNMIHVIRNAEPVADFALGLMFSETRNISRAHLAISKGTWQKSFSNDEYKTILRNQTVGIAGAGYIGKQLIKRLNGLGIKTYVYDPFVKEEALEKDGLDVTMLDTLEELFKTVDILSLHMRVTEETKEIVDEKLLNLMKPSAYIINTARADLIKKEDLIEALKIKKIAGAALDVSWTEPIELTDDLLSLDNITLTTHIAGDTVDAIPLSPLLLKDVINEYLEKGFSDMVVI